MHPRTGRWTFYHRTAGLNILKRARLARIRASKNRKYTSLVSVKESIEDLTQQVRSSNLEPNPEPFQVTQPNFCPNQPINNIQIRTKW